MTRKPLILFFLAAASLMITACVKEATLEQQQASTTRYLLAGKWLSTSRYVLVSSDAGSKVKDTTFKLTNASTIGVPANAWYVIFNKDSTAFVTTLPYYKTATTLTTDTTSRLKYIAVANTNIIFNYTNGSPAESDKIVLLTGYNLETSNTYKATPPAGWGLDATKTYTFVEDITYTKL